MGKIFSKLPSFAADYSGAAGVFYDMEGILATCDAGSCMGSYAILDEPRLFNETARLFSVNLREHDVVLGADKRIKSQIKETYERLGGECVSIMGTPVPTVIGTDFKGLAKEIEKDLGIPSFGIDTNGLEFYDTGQRKAYRELCNYSIKNPAENTADINIIGATPLDMWDLNQLQDMLNLLKEAGARNPVSWGANGKLKEIAGSRLTKLNIAVSVSAVLIVKKLHQEFKTPYMIGYPIGKAAENRWKRNVCNLLSGTGKICWNVPEKLPETEKTNKRVLIIGEQISSNALRDMLKEEYGYGTIDVFSYFQMYDEYKQKKDMWLETESDLTSELLNRVKYDVIIGDPLFFGLIPYQPARTIFMPHIAVSSRAFWDKSPNCFGKKGSLYFDHILKE